MLSQELMSAFGTDEGSQALTPFDCRLRYQ